MRLRITQARNALAGSDDKIEAIARGAGFVSTTHFCTVFRKWTGLTPADFRKRTQINLTVTSG